MERVAMRDNQGFTLVEIMVSLVVLMVMFLGMMQTVLVGIDSNMVNVMREEAVLIAEQEMNRARDADFPTLGNGGNTINRSFRRMDQGSGTGIPFTWARTVTPIDANNVQIQVQVTWPWKNQLFNHTIQTIVRNPNA
jgi:prepilin-type N-terminal cleavage/methylation domain-containing protein